MGPADRAALEQQIVIHLAAGVIGNIMDQDDGFKTLATKRSGRKTMVNSI